TLAERHRDHETAVDERSIADRQDVRMLEAMSEPRLAFEVLEEVLRHRTLVRNLECDALTGDRVDGLIDRRDRALGQASLDSVLAELLSCLQHRGRTGASGALVLSFGSLMIPADTDTV